jgi:chromosome segregation ATPase
MINTQIGPPPGFQASVQTTGSSISAIDAACNNVQNMPNYSSPYAPTLPNDINQAKAVANQWTGGVRNQVVGSLSGIVVYNNVFQSQFNQLYSISQQIAKGDMSQVTLFQSSLSILEQETQLEQQQVAAVQNSLTQYLIQIDGVMRALNNDNSELQNAYNSLVSQMQNLEQQMNEVQAKIDDEKSNIFSQFWYELTGQLQDLEKQQQQMQSQLSNTQQQLYNTQNALNTVRAYQNSFGSIQGGVNGLANGWESLNADLKETLADENITDYNAFTPALVQAASSDWQQVANLAQTFI